MISNEQALYEVTERIKAIRSAETEYADTLTPDARRLDQVIAERKRKEAWIDLGCRWRLVEQLVEQLSKQRSE